MYGSYQKPRELIWLGGWVTYVLLCAEGFTGYVLPSGANVLLGCSSNNIS